MDTKIYQTIIFSIASVGLFLTAIPTMRKEHPAAISQIFYIFSFVAVITGLAVEIAERYGVIDARGQGIGPNGDLFNSTIREMLDINLEVQFLMAVVAVAVLPQLLSYLLSAVPRCAVPPIWVFGSARFVIFGIAKFFIVGSGLLTAVVVAGLCKGWDGLSLMEVLAAFSFASVMLSIGFLLAEIYHIAGEVADKIGRRFIPNCIKVAHRWCSWYVRPEATPSPAFPEEAVGRCLGRLSRALQRSSAGEPAVEIITPDSVEELEALMADIQSVWTWAEWLRNKPNV